MVSCSETASQVQHHSLALTSFIFFSYLTNVNLATFKVIILRITKHPHFYPVFVWLGWIVIENNYFTSESNDPLIHCQARVSIIMLLTIIIKKSINLSDCSESISSSPLLSRCYVIKSKRKVSTCTYLGSLNLTPYQLCSTLKNDTNHLCTSCSSCGSHDKLIKRKAHVVQPL